MNLKSYLSKNKNIFYILIFFVFSLINILNLYSFYNNQKQLETTYQSNYNKIEKIKEEIFFLKQEINEYLQKKQQQIEQLDEKITISSKNTNVVSSSNSFKPPSQIKNQNKRDLINVSIKKPI